MGHSVHPGDADRRGPGDGQTLPRSRRYRKRYAPRSASSRSFAGVGADLALPGHLPDQITLSKQLALMTRRDSLARIQAARGKIPQSLLSLDIALRTPYDVIGFPMVETYLCAYGIRPVIVEAVARVLFGEIEARGILPCAIPDALAR
jgi:hypothetical protein